MNASTSGQECQLFEHRSPIPSNIIEPFAAATVDSMGLPEEAWVPPAPTSWRNLGQNSRPVAPVKPVPFQPLGVWPPRAPSPENGPIVSLPQHHATAPLPARSPIVVANFTMEGGSTGAATAGGSVPDVGTAADAMEAGADVAVAEQPVGAREAKAGTEVPAVGAAESGGGKPRKGREPAGSAVKAEKAAKAVRPAVEPQRGGPCEPAAAVKPKEGGVEGSGPGSVPPQSRVVERETSAAETSRQLAHSEPLGGPATSADKPPATAAEAEVPAEGEATVGVGVADAGAGDAGSPAGVATVPGDNQGVAPGGGAAALGGAQADAAGEPRAAPIAEEGMVVEPAAAMQGEAVPGTGRLPGVFLAAAGLWRRDL